MYNKKALSDAISKLNVAKAPKQEPDRVVNFDTKPFVSNQGYKQGPPPSNTHYRIPGDTIYNPTPYPLKAISSNGLEAFIPAYDTTNYTFPGADYVDEIPMAKRGGAKRLPKGKTKSLSGVNKLMVKNPLFRSYGHRLFDPSHHSFQPGGEKFVDSEPKNDFVYINRQVEVSPNNYTTQQVAVPKNNTNLYKPVPLNTENLISYLELKKKYPDIYKKVKSDWQKNPDRMPFEEYAKDAGWEQLTTTENIKQPYKGNKKWEELLESCPECLLMKGQHFERDDQGNIYLVQNPVKFPLDFWEKMYDENYNIEDFINIDTGVKEENSVLKEVVSTPQEYKNLRYHQEWNPFTKSYEAMSPKQHMMLDREAYKLQNKGVQPTPDNMPVFQNRELLDEASRKPIGTRSWNTDSGWSWQEGDIIRNNSEKLPNTSGKRLINKKSKKLITQSDNENNFVEAELTDEEIDQYRKGGFIVEELPKAQEGLTQTTPTSLSFQRQAAELQKLREFEKEKEKVKKEGVDKIPDVLTPEQKKKLQAQINQEKESLRLVPKKVIPSETTNVQGRDLSLEAKNRQQQHQQDLAMRQLMVDAGGNPEKARALMVQRAINTDERKQEQTKKAYEQSILDKITSPSGGLETGRAEATDEFWQAFIGAGLLNRGLKTAGSEAMRLMGKDVLLPGANLGNLATAYGAVYSPYNIYEGAKDISQGNYVDGSLQLAEGVLDAYIPGSRKLMIDGAQQAGKYLTTQTPLKNAYKINPNALKENPEMFLYRARPVGQNVDMNMAAQLRAKEAAGEPLTWYQKNLLNPQTNPQMLAREKYYGQWFEKDPSRLDFYINPGTRNFADNDIIEILRTKLPKSEANKLNVSQFDDAKLLSASPETEFILPKDMISFAETFPESSWQQLIQEDEAFNTPHWWRGYGSNTPKQLPGSGNFPTGNIPKNPTELSNTGFQKDPYYHYQRFLDKKEEIGKAIRTDEGRKRIQEYIDRNPHLQNKTVDDIISDFEKTTFEIKSPKYDYGKFKWEKDDAGNIKLYDVNPKNAYNWYRDGYEKPSYMSIGQNFTPYDAMHVLEHEFAHLFQRGDEIAGVDDVLDLIALNHQNLSGQVFKDFINQYNPFVKKYKDVGYSVTGDIYGTSINNPFRFVNLKNQKKYWLHGEGRGQEKAAFAAEIRENLLQRGILKNRYDLITPKMLEEHYKLYKNTTGPKHHLRLYDIMTNDKTNFQFLSQALNRMPAVIPYVGAGYLGYEGLKGAGAMQDYQQGGFIEAALTKKEIDDLRKQGYTIEEL